MTLIYGEGEGGWPAPIAFLNRRALCAPEVDTHHVLADCQSSPFVLASSDRARDSEYRDDVPPNWRLRLTGRKQPTARIGLKAGR